MPLVKILAVLVLGASLYGATPTYNAPDVTVASPNSVRIRASVTNAVSARVECGTDNAIFPVTTPWVAVASTSSTTVTMIAGQLQASTQYYCRLNATDATLSAFAAVSGNSAVSGSASAVTGVMPVSRPLSIQSDPAISYNAANYPTNYVDGDTFRIAWQANNNVVVTGNDGVGVNYAFSPGGRNMFTMGSNTTLSTLTTVNALTAFGMLGQNNFPACWNDNYNWKSGGITALGDTLYWEIYRQDAGGINNENNITIMRSPDGGTNWYYSASNTNANTPPCPGIGIMWTDTMPGNANASMIMFIETGKGHAVSNAVNGLDAYLYGLSRNITQTHVYLFRIYIGCITGCSYDLQTVGNWEYWAGAIGGDANLQANWSTSLASATSVYDPPFGNASVSGFSWYFAPLYLGEFNRIAVSGVYTLASGTDKSRNVFLDAASPTGPYNLVNWDARTPPTQNGTPLSANFSSWFLPSYTVTNTDPPAVTVTVVEGGGYNTRNCCTAAANLNPYSIQTAKVMITAAPPVAGSQLRGSVARNIRLSQSNTAGAYNSRGLEARGAQLWTFDGHQGKIAYPKVDPMYPEIISGTTCAIENMTYSTYTAGGGAFVYPQRGACNSTANTVGFIGDSSYTITAVIKPSIVSNETAIWCTGSASAYNLLCLTSALSGSAGSIGIRNYNGVFQSQAGVMAANQWYCISAVHTGGSGNVSTVNSRLYAGGAPLTVTVPTAYIPSVSADITRIAGTPQGNSRYFGGEIAWIDVRPGTALTDGEIKHNCDYLRDYMLRERGLTVQ